MSFVCVDAEGTPLFGCRQVDDGLKAMCDEVGGTIIDDQSGIVVYPVPGQEGDITYPLPSPEVDYMVIEDNIVAVDDGEVVEVVVELDMADIPPAEEIVVEDSEDE